MKTTNRKLRDKDIQKLSGLLLCPVQIIQKLDAMGLLNTTKILDLLLLEDWKSAKKNTQYKTYQIVEALIGEYQYSKAKIESIIYAKKKSLHWCRECGKQIPKNEHKRNNGICDRCLIHTIQF